MSRLDAFIRRMEAQRDCLNHALTLVEALPGPILEFGLGNGRSYDHLRERARGRPIFVFDRQIAAHPGSVPPEEFLILGDFAETLPQASERIGGPAVLAHLDIGSGRPEVDRAISRLVAGYLPSLLLTGGIVVSDQRLPARALRRIPLPAGVPDERYFLYCRADG